MRITFLFASLLPVWVWGEISSSGTKVLKTHTAFTKPLPLRQGEVTNSYHRLKIPTGPIAVYQFSADIVEFGPQGEVIPTPLYDAYLHHHVVGSNHRKYESMHDKTSPMKPKSFYKSIGFGAGTESRGTPQKFYHPYAFITTEGEDTWIANVHVINTRKLEPSVAHECLECPCTSENYHGKFSVGKSRLPWGRCNGELLSENNTACSLSTYYGGLRCCEHKQHCLERDQLKNDTISTYYLRYVIEYSDVTPETRPLYLGACCDATGNTTSVGNVEYDIEECDPQTNPGCVHTLTTKQYVSDGLHDVFQIPTSNVTRQIQDYEVELVYAVGHQHRGGMGIHIYNDATQELICSSIPQYGDGNTIGNEKDYIVAMTPCTFDPPLRLRTTDLLTIVSIYNSTKSHTGVMGLFYLALHDFGEYEVSLSHESRSTINVSSVAGLVVALVVAAFGIASYQIFKRRTQYNVIEPNLRI